MKKKYYKEKRIEKSNLQPTTTNKATHMKMTTKKNTNTTNKRKKNMITRIKKQLKGARTGNSPIQSEQINYT